MCDQSNTDRSALRFKIIPDLTRQLEFVLATRDGLTRRHGPPAGDIAFATVSGCRSATAFGFTPGELVIVDLTDDLTYTADEEDGEWIFVAPIRAIVARGVAL